MTGVSTSNFVNGLCTGTYTVTINDGAGCSLDTIITIGITARNRIPVDDKYQ